MIMAQILLYRGVTCFQQSYVSDSFQKSGNIFIIIYVKLSSFNILIGNSFVYIFNKKNIRKTLRVCTFLFIHLEHLGFLRLSLLPLLGARINISILFVDIKQPNISYFPINWSLEHKIKWKLD